ncbi:MAG: cupin 2 conserved barrel domain protein [Microgenomates bacterium 39_6]|nr:MAG: cupin 2 conserved barrel domain protein [Microgenomates bacterium 39_6]
MTKQTKYSQKTIKPWGWEILFTPENLPYAGKILFVKAGKRLSLQYHDQKQETLSLLKGKANLILENEKGKMVSLMMIPKNGYTINQGKKHRLEAITDCLIIEASTPEIGKTYRIEDDYNRKNEKLTEKS